ncbi:MAG: class I SAM-dependent methyltransferase [bacterium]
MDNISRHMETIKNHFEGEAEEFDAIILRNIPYYYQMVDALASAVSFQESVPIKVIDLGCGTGTISSAILKRYPLAQVTCLDLAPSMLEMAKIKLSGYPGVRYISGDFTQCDFDDRYDLVVSSLALHHVLTDDDKKQIYRRIFDNLTPNGLFYNADIVLASSDTLQEMYMSRWKEFLAKSVSQDEIENKWIPKYYEEDRPARFTNQLSWLSEIGFTNVDVIWKYYNFAVYGGTKP